MSDTPMTEAERVEFMQGIGLNPDTPAAWVPDPTLKLRAVEAASKASEIVLAPPGVDPRLMQVEEIVFDPRLLDGMPLEGPGAFKAAADHVFSFYKSYTKDKHRNSTLWRKVSMFVTTTKANRKAGGFIKEQVKATAEQRDVAAVIASQGLGSSDLAEALELLAQKRARQET